MSDARCPSVFFAADDSDGTQLERSAGLTRHPAMQHFMHSQRANMPLSCHCPDSMPMCGKSPNTCCWLIQPASTQIRGHWISSDLFALHILSAEPLETCPVLMSTMHGPADTLACLASERPVTRSTPCCAYAGLDQEIMPRRTWLPQWSEPLQPP